MTDEEHIYIQPRPQDFDKQSFTAFLINNDFPEGNPDTFFKQLSSSIRSDKYLVKLAMRKLHVDIFQYATEDRQNDRDLIVFGLYLDNNFLSLVDDKLKLHHREFLDYLLHNFQVYEFLPPKLQEDPEFILLAAKSYTRFTTLPVSHYNNKKLILECLKYDSGVLEHISEEMKEDPEIAKALIDLDPLLLYSCGDGCQTNRDLMIYACERNGIVLEGAIDEFQDDELICFTAVAQFGSCLKYCSPKWQNDKKLVLLSLEKHSLAIQYVSEELRADPAIARQALVNEMYSPQEDAFIAFEFLQHFATDKEMVYLAVKRNPASLKFVGKDFKNDKELVLLAVYQEGAVLEFASESLQSDPEVVQTAVRNNGLAIRFASAKIKENMEIVAQALRQNGNSLEFTKFRRDERMCFISVQSRGESIRFVEKITPEILKAALEENGDAYFEIQDENLKTKAMTLLAIQNGADLELGNVNIDHEFYMELAKRSGKPFSFFQNEEIFGDEEIMNLAIKTNPSLLFRLKNNLTSDEALIWNSLELDHSLSAIPLDLQSDQKLLFKALKNPTNFMWISDLLRKDEKFILERMQETKNDDIPCYIHFSLLSKIDFALQVVSICPGSYIHFPRKIQTNKEIAQLVLGRNGHLLAQAPQKIQNDIVMVSIAFKNAPSCIMSTTPEIRNQFLSNLIENIENYDSNEESMKILIMADPTFFSHCSLKLKRNSKFLEEMVTKYPVPLDSTTIPFLTKKALITCIKRKQENIFLDLVQTSFLKDRDIIMAVIENQIDMLNYTDILRSWKNDEEVMILVFNHFFKDKRQKQLLRHLRTHESSGIFGKTMLDWIPLTYLIDENGL